MKNPWMRVWLSAANTMTSAARGQMAAEMSLQQSAMVNAWTKAATEAWMTAAFPWLPRSRKHGR